MIWPHSCVTASQQQPNHTVKCLLVSTSVAVLRSPKAHIIIINVGELGKKYHSDERTPLFQDHFSGILCLPLPTQMIPWPGMLKGEPSRRCNLACKRTKHANMSIYGLHLLLLSTFLQKKYSFFFNCKSELPWAQPCWFALHQWRAEKGWLTTYSIHLPHMPNLYTAFVLEHFLAPCFIDLFMFFVKCIERFIWMTSQKANFSTQRQ